MDFWTPKSMCQRMEIHMTQIQWGKKGSLVDEHVFRKTFCCLFTVLWTETSTAKQLSVELKGYSCVFEYEKNIWMYSERYSLLH